MRRIGLCLCCALASGLLWAQASGGPYRIEQEAIAAGGGSAEGGGFAASVTVGQSAAAVSSGGAFRLSGGFHRPQPAERGDAIFADGFEP